MHLLAASRHPRFLFGPVRPVSLVVARRANSTITDAHPSITPLTSILIANRGEIALSVRTWTQDLTPRLNLSKARWQDSLTIWHKDYDCLHRPGC